MSIHKSWTVFDTDQIAAVPGTVGVYELGDAAGNVIYIGFAGALQPFGLRGVISSHFSEDEPNETLRRRARMFRFELTARYLTRAIELLTMYREERGDLPEASGSEAYPFRIGRFHRNQLSGDWQL